MTQGYTKGVPIDTDGTLSLNSNALVPSQAAVVTYVGSQIASSGAVTSVTGTANRITISGAATTPIVDVSTAYVGQASITTLGTITTGVWTGTDIAVADGGTGRSSHTAYAVICGGTTATDAQQSIASVGTAAQVLTSNGAGALPTFQNAAAGGDVAGPASATDNALVRFDGTTGKLIQNGVITEDDTGNLSITASVSGATLSATISNTSNTASSNANSQITVGGTSAGDAQTTYTVSGTTNWSTGIDNSVTGDPFIIAASTALGSTNVMSMTTAGEVTKPLQPAFLAVLDTSDLNVTGNAANYTLGSGNALTEIFDQGGDFVTTGTFTAPVTGRYHLNFNITFGGVTSAMTYTTTGITTSNRTYPFGFINSAAARTVAAAADLLETAGSVLSDMDAADTYTVVSSMHGGAGNTADISASAARVSMSGNLVC